MNTRVCLETSSSFFNTLSYDVNCRQNVIFHFCRSHIYFTIHITHNIPASHHLMKNNHNYVASGACRSTEKSRFPL